MQFVRGLLFRKPSTYSNAISSLRCTGVLNIRLLNARLLSGDSQNSGSGEKPKEEEFSWDAVPSWSTGLTKEHFDGQAVGHKVDSDRTSSARASYSGSGISATPESDEYADLYAELEEVDKRSRAFADGWKNKVEDVNMLMKQVNDPGSRGSYLKNSEKNEMYRLHKENPEVYTVERLAKDYRILRQRVEAILYLKKDQEEIETRLGHPLDDTIERLIDSAPELFKTHDIEFHVAKLPQKPDFKVMPEDWDGTIKDRDEVHYELSKKQDDQLYEEFHLNFKFNQMKARGEVKQHLHSRVRPAKGWDFVVEKMGPHGKRGAGGGRKFVSEPDGSIRRLNATEKIYLQRETRRRRRRLYP